MRARLLAMAVLTSILAAGTVRAEPTADASAPTVITPAPTAPAATAQVPATPAASLPAAKAAGQPAHETILLEAGSGRVVMLGGAAANVYVADPKVAEVRAASATSLFVFGVGPGQTTVAVMDAGGVVVGQYEVTVRRSDFAATEAQAQVARLLPRSRVVITPQPKGLLLTGAVANASDAARAVAVARGFLGDGQAIENQLTVNAPVQVSLRVRIAEVSRQVTRNLGVDWLALGSIGRIGQFAALSFSRNGSVAGGACGGTSTTCLGANFNAVIDALAQDNLVRILAEPNMTVMSGQTASFLAGGEFPVPVAQQNNTTTIEFKKFGVALTFVPTVLNDGRINLHVAPEVSTLTDQGAVTTSAIAVKALSVRRAETTVELGSGQSFAIAGLLQDSTTQGNHGLPGAGDLPVLGALFRSDQFVRNETELVVIVTPYIVRPVDDPAALHTPNEASNVPGDFDRILLLRQNGREQVSVAGRIPGAGGFIVQ
jgi:pilus assembly protein CpaC